MGKIVKFIESNLFPLIRALNENTEEGEFTIGMEDNAPVGGEYYHVMDDDDKNITESNNVSLMGDINNVNTIVFYPHENGFEEGYTEDDINEFEPYYEIDAMDINGDTILCADLTVAELFDYFPESIVNDIIDRESSNSTECVNKDTNEFRIDDIVYRDTTPKDINDVNEVNKIAKRIQTGGESAYLLVDGDVISFYDHIQITNIDGMTPSKFISLGNIRLVVGGGVQLIKRPTTQQTLVLKSWLRNKDKVYLDISKESNYTYPEVICSANYTNVSPNRIVGDILAYFDDGIRPQDVWMESKEGENMNASNLIIESQESKSIAASKKLVMQRLNYSEQEADEFIRIKLRNDIPSLRTPQGGKFILGVTRMFCDGELRNANDIGNLNSTLKLVASDAHINEYDRNLNNLSCQELVQRFARAMSDNLEAERDEVNQMVFDSPSDYEVVRIDSFEQAQEYGKYVNWCVTHDAYMFNSYTSDGINQFYFCLKNGFENVAPQPSDGCPLDEYGLSMFAVSVNENGMLNTCTCRWNHDNGGNDSIMNTKQISKVIGMNFFEVFKPNNVWKETLANATQRLANGEDPKTVFDGVGFFKEGFADVRLYRKDNFIDKDGRILSEQWFDKVFSFNEGFARVELNNKCNFINQEGRFLSDQWFNGCRDFRDGFGVVRLNEKYNFISTNGNLLSNQWFDWCSEFNGGFASVELGEKWNYISTDGRLLTSQWFDWCGGFEGGFGGIQADKKYNFVDANGNIISNQWFDSITNFHEGFAGVQIGGKWNFINQYGRIISKVWFDKLVKFQDGLAKVTLDGKFNFISSNGNLISNQWFDSVGSFYGENFTSVEVGNKSNFINRKGILLSDQWFDECYDFSGGFGEVGLNGKYNFIGQDGKILSNQWFDECYNFVNGFARVKLNGKWNFINQDGKILSNQWFDNCRGFRGDGFAWVSINGRTGEIDANGNLALTETINRKKAIIINENQLKKLNENLEFEVDSSEVDLSSFKKQDSLPSIWKDEDTLDSKVRLKLLDIADDFWEFVNVNWVEPKGIIITGSLCNYNWSDYSDVDLHLIVDFNEIGDREDFVRQYLDSKKNEWNDEHGSLKIYGYPVELYVQNIDEDVSAGGIYDLEENKWIRKPSYDDIDEIDLKSDEIKDEAARIMTIIDDMWSYFNKTNDSHKLELLGNDADNLWRKIKDMRKNSLEDGGEMSDGNIVYKYMRRKKYLDKLFDLRAAIYDKSNTITESMSLLGESDQSLDLFVLAKERFGTTYDIRECGYILPDGSMLDFSGRSSMEKGADSSYLRGGRHVDHRDIYTIGWSEDGNTKNFDVEMDEFIRLGAIRTHVSSSYSLFNLFRKPTKKQADLMMRIIRYAGGCVDVEIGDGYESITSGEYDGANPRRVMSDIIRYFDEGINLMGNVNENISESAAYDKFREGQAFRYRIIGVMIKDGYLFHGTGSEFDEFESDRIRGEERGVYGYGAYFTNAAYKCEEYGNHFTILDSNGFNFLDIEEKVRPEYNIFKEKLGEFSKIEAGLDNARSNREYDYYNNLYDEYRSTVDTNLLERFVSILEKNGVTDYNNLNKLVDYSFTNIENKDIQKRISQLYLSMGYDGFVCENQFVIFNFNKLNDNIVKDKEALIARYEEGNLSEVKKYIKLLKSFSLNEEVVADGSANGNPYSERWKAEREALKNFISNFGTLMQSKEDNKEGRVYKVYYDKLISDLIGYNYCLCVQYDEVKNKPKSTVYVRAYDKFTPFIRRNLQFDDRGLDNQRATADDIGNSYQPVQIKR